MDNSLSPKTGVPSWMDGLSTFQINRVKQIQKRKESGSFEDSDEELIYSLCSRLEQNESGGTSPTTSGGSGTSIF